MVCRDEVDINLNIELESFLSSQALLGQTSSQVAEQVMMFPPMRSHAESASFNQSGTRKLVTV